MGKNEFVPSEDITRRLPDGRRVLVWNAGRPMTIDQAREFGLIKDDITAPSVGPSETKANDDLDATPMAKRLARKHGISLQELAGSGAGGRILLKDVKDAI